MDLIWSLKRAGSEMAPIQGPTDGFSIEELWAATPSTPFIGIVLSLVLAQSAAVRIWHFCLPLKLTPTWDSDTKVIHRSLTFFYMNSFKRVYDCFILSECSLIESHYPWRAQEELLMTFETRFRRYADFSTRASARAENLAVDRGILRWQNPSFMGRVAAPPSLRGVSSVVP